MLFIAIIFFVLIVVVFFAGLYFLASVYSAGTASNPTNGGPFKKYSIGVLGWFAAIFLFIAWIWIFLFLFHLGNYIISAMTCEKYFQSDGGVCGAIFHTLIYHMGTVAWSSICILPSTIFQLFYGWIYDLISKTGNEAGEANWLQKGLSYACICIKWPYKKFFMRTGQWGYPLSYLASCNFCPATKEAYYLKESYSTTLGDTGLVNSLYRITAVLAIVFLNTFIAYMVFTYLPFYQQYLTNSLFPTVVTLLANAISLYSSSLSSSRSFSSMH